MSRADFDTAAVSYDRTFTRTGVGRAQRNQVWRFIDQLSIDKKEPVLEINCGTGEDAQLWQERGFSVTATDLSAEMIAQAHTKYPAIDFRTWDMRNISSLNLRFGVLFSDFGGINCLNEDELRQLLKDASTFCSPDGRLIWVIMGKKCRWDYWYMIRKGRFSERNRRNTRMSVSVPVDGTNVTTYYYSPQQIRQWAAPHFKVELLRPIGYFVPPSYLSPFFEKRPVLLRLLEKLDQLVSFSWLANRSDHYLISLRKHA